MNAQQMLYAQIVSNIVAAVMVLLSWRWPTAGRSSFALLFLWAGEVNLRTALSTPQVYLEYAPLAYSDWYQAFILGFFASHIVPIVSTIALAQLSIALLVCLRGNVVRLGLAGAIAFLIAIAPLGVGSGFPTTIIMGIAAVILLRTTYTQTLPHDLLARIRRNSARKEHATS
jgi:hypothetical protein